MQQKCLWEIGMALDIPGRRLGGSHGRHGALSGHAPLSHLLPALPPWEPCVSKGSKSEKCISFLKEENREEHKHWQITADSHLTALKSFLGSSRLGGYNKTLLMGSGLRCNRNSRVIGEASRKE